MEFFWGIPGHVSDAEQKLYFRGEDEPDYGKEVILVEGPWRLLPVPALQRVYEYLDDEDRFSVSVTCKSWSEMFNHPCLWHHRRFRYVCSRASQSMAERLVAYAKRFGKYLRHLEIGCEHPTYSMCKKFQKSFTELVGVLVWKNCQLRELVVPRIFANRYWRLDLPRDRLVNSLARLIRKQTQLQTFDMSDGGFSIQNGFKILEALTQATKAKQKLRTLNLEDFFHPDLFVCNATKYCTIFNGLKHLTSLYINYSCLNDDALKILARTCASTLKVLSIKAHKVSPHAHRLEPMLWKQLRRACPALKVTLYLECMGEHADFVRLLSRDIPLTSLQVWTGIHNQHEDWNLPGTLKYIADVYSHTLQELSLGLDTGMETVDEAFLYMVRKLKWLEDLEIQATMGVDTLDQLLKMQQEYTIGLTRCHMSFDDLLPIEQEDLQEVRETYQDMIDQRGLDFRFECNEPILL